MVQNSTTEDFRNISVLVTGGCGFIGSHLVEALINRGAFITVLDNMQAGTPGNLSAVSKGTHIVEGDVRDDITVERVLREAKPEFVFHLAANASVPGSVDDPVYDFETNCAGTFTLLNALRKTERCRKVVVASSGAVYGEPTTFPITEESFLCPISPYGASKLAAEIEARMFHKVYETPVVIARLFNVYGPRMARFVILDFLRKLQKNPQTLKVLGSGQQIRDFTFVSDTVAGLLALSSCGQIGDSYNVSSGRICSITELAKTVITALNMKQEPEIVYTGNSWVGDAQRWEVSIEKIKSIGYLPLVTLEQGLSQTIDCFVKTYGPIK